MVHRDKCSLNENRNNPRPTLYNGQPTYTLSKHFPTNILELYGMFLIDTIYTRYNCMSQFKTGKCQAKALYFTHFLKCHFNSKK